MHGDELVLAEIVSNNHFEIYSLKKLVILLDKSMDFVKAKMTSNKHTTKEANGDIYCFGKAAMERNACSLTAMLLLRDTFMVVESLERGRSFTRYLFPVASKDNKNR